MNRKRVPVLLAIQSGVFRLALAAVLEQASFDVLDWFGSGEVLGSPPNAPALAIVDAGFAPDRAFDLARELQNCFPGIPVLLLAESHGDPDVVEALRAGMRGYVLKSQPGAELVEAVRAVLRGGIYMSPDLLAIVVPQLLMFAKDCKACMTAHDLELLRVIAEGKNMVQASALMGVAHEELVDRRRRLKTTLGVRSTAGLVRYAVRHRLVAP